MRNRLEPRGRNLLGRICAAFVFAAMAGCGSTVYEYRLEQTKRYYEYLADGNRLLSHDEFSDQGIKLRPPREFELLEPSPEFDASAPDTADASAVETTRDEEGFEERVFIETPDIPPEGSDPSVTPTLPKTELPAARDPRQPDFINYDMPGLMAAWQAEFEVSNSGPRRGYMYLLSNHKRWQSQGSPTGALEPEAFLEDFKNSFDYALRTEPTIEVQEPDRYEERLPKGQGYVPTKKIERFRYRGTIKGAPTEIMLYLYEEGSIQVALVFIVPGGTQRERDLQQAMVYTVEWMKVSGEKPRGGAAGKAGRPQSGF